jgi:hypothetical protein
MAGSATLNVAVLVNAAQAAAGLNQVGDKAESVGSKMTKAFAGLALGAGLLSFAKDAVQSLSRIEKINAQSAQTIKSTGGAANVSAQHVEDLALSIESLTATEAESVQEGANLLLTFTNIKNEAGQGNDVFDQATQTLTDMSRALGTDVSASAIQLGKALNDPIKGVSALSKVGVSFTADQKNLIKTLVESGDVMGAQKIILGELNKEFGGSGAAYAQTAAGQWDMFNDALGDFGMQVVSTVMPALQDLVSFGTTGIGWISELPGGVQLAIGAFLTFLAFGPKIMSMMSGIGGAIKGATGSMAGFKAAMVSLATTLGSAALFTGVVLAIGGIISAIQHSSSVAKEGEDALKGYRDAIVEAGGASTDATAEAFKNAVVNSKAFEALIADGVSAEEAVKLLTGTTEDFARSGMTGSHAARTLSTNAAELTQSFIDANGQAKGLALSQIEGKAALEGAAGAAELHTAATEADTAAMELSEEAIKELETEFKNLQQTQKDALAATDASKLIAELDRTEAKAERAGKVIHDALESAFPERGRLRSTGLSDLVGQVGELGDKIKQEDVGGKIKAIFLDIENMDPIKLSMLGDPGEQVRSWAGGFQTSWDAALTETFKNTGGNVEQTVTDMLGHTKNLTQGVADQLGIPFEEAEQIVAASIGNIDAQTLKDKVLQITADDQAAFEKVLFYDSISFDPVNQVFTSTIQIPAVAEIVAQLNSKFGLVPPVPIPVTTGPLDPAAPTIMEQLIAGLPPVPGPVVTPSVNPVPVEKDLATISGTKTSTTVDIKGNPKPATGTIAGDVVNPRRETYPVAVIANSAPARNAIEAFRRDYAGLQLIAIVNANTAPARNAVEAFRGDYGGVSVTATILGNSAPARNAIAAVEDGSYSATVRIFADTSAFFSSFNALPGTRSVASAPRTSFAAPTLSVTPAASGAPVASQNLGSASITVNVTGAVDADASARQIRNLLQRRERRSSGIKI